MSEELQSQREKLTALRVRELEEKSSLELTRFKQNCRTKAFDWAMEKDFSGGDEHVIKKATQYYEWLTKDLN